MQSGLLDERLKDSVDSVFGLVSFMDLRASPEVFNIRRYGDGPFQTKHADTFPPEFLPRLMHPASLVASWTTVTRTQIELLDRGHPAVVLSAEQGKPRQQACGPQVHIILESTSERFFFKTFSELKI